MPEANAEGTLKKPVITTILNILIKTTSFIFVVVSTNSVRYEQRTKTKKFLYLFRHCSAHASQHCILYPIATLLDKMGTFSAPVFVF